MVKNGLVFKKQLYKFFTCWIYLSKGELEEYVSYSKVGQLRCRDISSVICTNQIVYLWCNVTILMGCISLNIWITKNGTPNGESEVDEIQQIAIWMKYFSSLKKKIHSWKKKIIIKTSQMTKDVFAKASKFHIQATEAS